jgi:hypothetical protein
MSQSLIIGTLATVGLISGVIPDITAKHSNLIFSSVASAQQQQIESSEIRSYALAVLGMEPARQEAYDEIKRIINREPPAIVCNKPDSFKALPGNARNIALNYCKRSKEIVESNGLTIARFNEITQQLQRDDNLKRRISNELLRLQNAAGAR